jgi:rhamnose utilization protein RhaD (predicted bifunctional aldolase and dehydrogenase)
LQTNKAVPYDFRSRRFARAQIPGRPLGSSVADKLDEPELLRYRSNLLGSDLRITNFAGGNTSSKVERDRPAHRAKVKVLWVKGSGGDLGSIKRTGFATLYRQAAGARTQLPGRSRQKIRWWRCTRSAPSGVNPVAASIDTPLHGFLPFRHVDHLHPDWGIALAASANGKEKMEEFNREFEHKLVWVPVAAPGF